MLTGAELETPWQDLHASWRLAVRPRDPNYHSAWRLEDDPDRLIRIRHILRFSGRVVEDDPERMPTPRSQPAHAVPHVDAIVAACPSHRPMDHRKHHAMAL